MNKLQLPTDNKDTNEFFDEDAISKSTIQALNNSFDKQQLDEQIERPFTPIEEQEEKNTIPKEQCPYCKRMFFQGRLILHLHSCNADHPFLKKKKMSKLLNTQPVQQPCPYCKRKFRNADTHINKCSFRPKAIDKYQVIASINEEPEDTYLQELSNSQPSFLPKIKQRPENLLSRSVPIVKCPSCQKTFEQKTFEKHLQTCQHKFIYPKSVFCTNCGSKFANNHKYCGSCGKKRI